MTRVLFITWDAPEATYLEALFLPAFQGLSGLGYAFDVLQFRWGDRGAVEASAAACAQAGIGYRNVVIDRRWGAAGPLKSALLGGGAVRDAARAFRSDWIMPRSLFAGIAALSSGLAQPMLFDCDGFAADERAEHGGWRKGVRYYGFRAIERRLARRARASTVRTSWARLELARRAGIPATRVYAVTNGRDPRLFGPIDPNERDARRADLGLDPSTLLMVHAGSVGPQYELWRVDPLITALRDRGAEPRLLLLNGAPDRARADLLAVAPIAAKTAIVSACPPGEVGRWLALADVGLAFRAPSLSMRAVAPLKLAEYMLSGLPTVGSAVAGDPVYPLAADLLFDQERGPDDAANWILRKIATSGAVRAAAGALARERYSLDRMIADYAQALDSMGGA